MDLIRSMDLVTSRTIVTLDKIWRERSTGTGNSSVFECEWDARVDLSDSTWICANTNAKCVAISNIGNLEDTVKSRVISTTSVVGRL